MGGGRERALICFRLATLPDREVLSYRLSPGKRRSFPCLLQAAGRAVRRCLVEDIGVYALSETLRGNIGYGWTKKSFSGGH